MLSESAREAGWDVIICADAETAAVAFRRMSFHFALVDLDLRGDTPRGFREFCEKLAADSPQLLLGICGHEECAPEEIWARQLGIWLYLPGTTNSAEMSLLCAQAMQIAREQSEPSTRAVS